MFFRLADFVVGSTHSTGLPDLIRRQHAVLPVELGQFCSSTGQVNINRP
jgi:hypothetical protein